MTRLRRPKTTVGRTQYQLRMPFPGTFTPENTMMNFREIARWANELPHAHDDHFVPYFIEYKPEDPEESWDLNLVTILQSKFATDLMPTGTWLVHTVLSPTEVPVGAVGVDARIVASGPNIGIPGGDYRSIGYIGDADGIGGWDAVSIKVVTDLTIDFTAEDFELTYEWFLPSVQTLAMGVKAMSLNLVKVTSASSDIIIQGEARAATMDDPTAGPELTTAAIPSYLYAWAYRLSDGYNIPTQLEDVTP